ncbi:MAG TPA: SGNH/GDSL hydrolase family protein [Actinocrinis sp.]|uniref:SGNH/GDSL hydrolase family protein n=1 Tax=Actinocrinis sp. TaxID=1920516 RepID=UPI002D70B158|nr:SGNH/GDSL hydrolase family protein [Actinocrinis sp.]HZU54297.1 SGNH/GDSL hydrolase family protein [Actinocrinis sp.]
MPNAVRARATVAVGGALLLAVATANAAVAAPPGKYVSLGDSYVSGPLIPDQVNLGCLRSDQNYPSLTAAAEGVSGFADVSCGAATTDDMTQSQADGPIVVNGPQLDAVTSDDGLVTLGIGGNDIGFISIIATCAGESLTNPFGSPCTAHYTAGGTDQLAAAIDATAPKVGAVLQAIHQRAPYAKVLVVGYPDILPEYSNGCWPLEPIAYGDVSYLRSTEKRLNSMLAEEAAANNAQYVDTYTSTIGHDVCQAPGTKWIEGLVPLAPAAPFHPNAQGEAAMARALEADLGS